MRPSGGWGANEQVLCSQRCEAESEMTECVGGRQVAMLLMFTDVTNLIHIRVIAVVVSSHSYRHVCQYE